jgi:3-phenylpropionate/trans-cinnamate dioxygenase ferredoxin subunit
MDYEIECPKHNATSDYRTVETTRAPACVNLSTYPTKVEGGRVWVEV